MACTCRLRALGIRGWVTHLPFRGVCFCSIPKWHPQSNCPAWFVNGYAPNPAGPCFALPNFWLQTIAASSRQRNGSSHRVHPCLAKKVWAVNRRRPHRAHLRPATENAVVLDDGTSLPADVIVYATGYGSMNGWAADLISKEVADKVGKVWGLGSDTSKDPGPWEGEQRNMWKPTQQEALWFHGGNLHQSRHYSQFLSLQLKARMEGIPTPVYGLQPSHHMA